MNSINYHKNLLEICTMQMFSKIMHQCFITVSVIVLIIYDPVSLTRIHVPTELKFIVIKATKWFKPVVNSM